MKNSKLFNSDINVDCLARMIDSHIDEIVFVQWVGQFNNQKYPCPNIFVGNVYGLDSKRSQLNVNGVGALALIKPRAQYIPIEKKFFFLDDKFCDYLGLARIVDSKRNVVFQDSKVVNIWNRYYNVMIRELHSRSQSREIKNWLDSCNIGCLQYHSLMDVYLDSKVK